MYYANSHNARRTYDDPACIPLRWAMRNLLVFAVSELLDQFTTQGSQAGQRNLIVLGLFMTASELGAINRQLRGVRTTARKNANNWNLGGNPTRNAVNLTQLRKVAGTHKTAMDEMGTPSRPDYGEIGRLGELYTQVFNQNRIVGISVHDLHVHATPATRQTQDARKKRETDIVLSVIYGLGTLRTALIGRPFPTCLFNNYVVFPTEAHSFKKRHNPLDCEMTFPLRIPDKEEVTGDLDAVETSRQPSMPTPSPSVSGESTTLLYSRTGKTTAATSRAPAPVVHPRRSVPLTSATRAESTPVATMRKSKSSVSVASSEHTPETSTKRSASPPKEDIPVLDIVSDDDEDEDVDAPAYDFYSDDSDEDSEDHPSDVEEIEAEESPSVGQTENSPLGLRVTFDTNQASSARRILSEPDVLEKSVQKLKVRSPEQADISQLTPRQRAQLNVRNAKAAVAPRIEEQMDTGSPKRPAAAPPGFHQEPVTNPEFLAAGQQFYHQTAYGIISQASQVQPLNLTPLGRAGVLKLNRERIAAEGPGPKSMEAVVQLERQRLQQTAVAEGVRKDHLTAEADNRRLSTTDSAWHGYQLNRRHEAERAQRIAAEARLAREMCSRDKREDAPTIERGREPVRLPDRPRDQQRGTSGTRERSKSGKRLRDQEEIHPSRLERTPGGRILPPPPQVPRPKDVGKYEQYSKLSRSKTDYVVAANKKTPTSSPLGKSQKISSIVEKLEKNSAEEKTLLETGRDPKWNYSTYDDKKAGHFTKSDVKKGEMTFRRWVQRTTDFNEYKAELSTLGIFGEDLAIERAQEVITMVRVKVYGAMFGCKSPIPGPVGSWIYNSEPAPFGSIVPALQPADEKLLQEHKDDVRFESMIAWELLLSRLQYHYDALMARRRGSSYGGRIRPHSPLVLWILHLVNRCMIHPHVIRWHVVRDRMTPWTRWNNNRPLVDRCRLELKCTTTAIDTADRENVRRDAAASRTAIIDYGKIWVECQEQMLKLNRTVAPPFVKTKVELPDDFDMRPLPVARVKRVATEPTSAPAPTTIDQAKSKETVAVSYATPPIVVTGSSATATPAEEMDDLEDTYDGPDPLAGIREDYNPSSQGEQPMDTNESQEKIDILATAIVEGVGDLQQEYQGTTGRSYTHHEYHPTPTALSPLNSADETLADRLLSETPSNVATSEIDQLINAASTATGVTSVTYDTTVQTSNTQAVEQGNSGLVRLTNQPTV